MSATGLVHWDDIEARPVDAGPLSGSWTDLGGAAGSVTTGLRRIRLESGRRSTPVHAHDAEEEIFYVLAGSGLSWQDGEVCEVDPADCIVQPRGGAAHTLIATDGGLDVLAFGTRHAASSARLPRAGVAWLGPTWVEVGKEPHPWARELAAGELAVPPVTPRPANVVGTGLVDAELIGRGDTHRTQRALGAAAGAVLTGLNHVTVAPGKLSCPPHVHSCEEEIFVVLDGAGTLELYAGPSGGWQDAARSSGPTPERHAVARGSVVVRPAGTGVAHAFRAGDEPLVLLTYGERRSDEVCFYPRSAKLRIRGLGLTFRAEPCGYWDGETPVE